MVSGGTFRYTLYWMPREPDIAAVRAEMSESFERIQRQVEIYRRELFRALRRSAREPQPPRLNWSGVIMLVKRPEPPN
jgi:hypothetical protein